MYQQIKILSHVFKSDLDTYKLGYYKLAEGFRLLNWIDWNFSDTPAFYKQTYYSYHAVFKFLSNLKQNSGRNLLRLLAEIPDMKSTGYEESIVKFVWGRYVKHPLDMHSETGILKLILQFLSLQIL